MNAVTTDRSAATDIAPSLPAEDSAVIVRLGDAVFGLPVELVREVLRTPPLAPVPFTPPAVAGVVSVRGEILPVLDLGERLLGRPAARPGRLVIVATPEFGSVALLVDALVGLAGTAATVSAPPEIEAALPPGLLRGMLKPASGPPIALLDGTAVLALGTPYDEDAE